MTRLEKMALGRRKAYLLRCVTVIELLEKHETRYTVRSRIFKDFIKPVMNCSYTTFNNMLNEPNPRKELESIENKLKEL
jgi:hypothetical protein